MPETAQTLGISSFEVEMWPIDRPIPYARNPRKISETAISKVAGSLKEFGWRQPIVVDPEGVIVVGHTRLLAAQRLGLARVPVHVAHELSENQIKAYRLADNRVGEESSWEDEMLGLELSDLEQMGIDLGIVGFDDGELAALMGTAVPSLDELEGELGEHDEEAFWPQIKLKVPPEVFERYEALMRQAGGADDVARFTALLDLVEGHVGGALDDAA